MLTFGHRHAVLTAVVVTAVLAAADSIAGFSGTDVFLPSVGRKPGNFGSQYYTMLWIHNPSTSTANVTIAFLLRNQPNPSPATFLDAIPPGDSRSYPDTITTLFNTQAWGALHITSNVRVFAVCRMYNLPAGGQDKDTQGQGYNAIPASFAIGSGQSTKLLGVSQTSPKADSEFRYSFGWVEAAGGTANVQVIAFDETGTQVASKTYPTTGAYEARYYAIEDLDPAVNSANLTLQVSVVSGTGKVIAVGSGTANASNDSTTFEMQFADALLSGTGGLSAVTHDASLTGDGTASTPLGIANGQVVRSLNGLHDAVTLTAGANVTITPAGQTLTIAAPGGGGGSGVTNVNGITGAVTIAGSGGTTVNTTGNTITVSGSGGGITGVTAGTGLTGGGTSGNVTVGIANGGVGNAQIASTAVTTDKISAGGSSSGQVLTSSGSNVSWQAVAGLTLPYSGSVNTQANNAAFGVSTTNGFAIYGVNSSTSGPAINGWASGGGAGVAGGSGSGFGVQGTSTSAQGVLGVSTSSYGVEGRSSSSSGVYGSGATGVQGSGSQYGLAGSSTGANGAGVIGTASGANMTGVLGTNTSGVGVNGQSTGGDGVVGSSGSAEGVYGVSSSGDGVSGTTASGAGVHAYCIDGGAAARLATNQYAVDAMGAVNIAGKVNVSASSSTGNDIFVVTNNGSGRCLTLWGTGDTALWANSSSGVGVDARSTSGNGINASSSTGYAGKFNGSVQVTGTLSKGGGAFKIDHPLDPEHKYLYHSFVESPDMKNVYDGVVTTDAQGLAVVQLPDWFEALNRDFRYQLTVIGRFAQAIVEQEIANNRFVIRTNLANVKVSWQVTGIRKDPFANANRIPVEEEKPAVEQGFYLHPEAWGQPEEKGLEWALQPELMRELKARRDTEQAPKP